MNYKSLTENTLALIDEKSQFLLREVESVSPGHKFGKSKYEHMKQLASEAAQVAEKYGLSEREKSLFTVICRAHDIGRHLSVILDDCTISPEVPHGKRGSAYLDQEKVLKAFPASDQDIVLYSVESHSEKELLPLPGHMSESDKHCAQSLCQLFRNLDQIEILEGLDYTRPAGIIDEISVHVASTELAEKLGTQREKALRLISRNLIKPQEFQGEAWLKPLYDYITTPPCQNSLDTFCSGSLLEKPMARRSLADYLLYQLAMCFELEGKNLKSRIRKAMAVKRRLVILSKRACPSDMIRINKRLEDSLS